MLFLLSHTPWPYPKGLPAFLYLYPPSPESPPLYELLFGLVVAGQIIAVWLRVCIRLKRSGLSLGLALATLFEAR